MNKGSAGHGLATGILLVAQVAICLALLVSAGLFVRTLHNFGSVCGGFNALNLLVFRMRPAEQSPAATYELYDRLVAAIDAVPGVRATTHSAMPLIAGMEGVATTRPVGGIGLAG